MARIRTIKPEFWTDEDIAGLSEPAMLLAIGLLNYSDDEGWFNANYLLIKAAVFPLREPSKTIPRMIQELSGIDYISIYPGPDGKQFGQVLNFSKHQRVDKPRPSEIKKLVLIQEQSRNDQGKLPPLMEGNVMEVERETDPPPTPKKKSGSKRVPQEFQVTEDLLAWAKENTPGVDIKLETGNFRDHEFKAARVDWPAAWRKWMRNSLKYLEERGGPNKPQPPARSIGVIPKDEVC